MTEETDGVETAADFAALMETSGVMEWLTDTPPGDAVADTPALPDTDGTPDRPRDDKGRYVSTKPEDDQAGQEGQEGQSEGTDDGSGSDDPSGDAGTETPDDGQSEEQGSADEDGAIVLEIDDDLQTILDKYDGDIGKALRALNDSQSMIGRQANEVGDLRRELQAMKQALEEGFARQPQQVYAGPYQNDVDENPQGLVMEALERGDGRTMEIALRAWGEEDPFGATTFLLTLQQQAAQAAQAAPAQVAAPTTPTGTGPTIEQAMSEVVQRHPDVEKYLPQVQQVAQEFPTLRDSMQSGAPAAQAQAFEELLKIAKTRDQARDTSTAMKKVILKTQEEVRKEKSDAAVVSAQNQSAATRETRLDEFYRAFGEAAERYESADWITRSND